jgi:murein L,D-transpeptidase YcbB/YkuD
MKPLLPTLILGALLALSPSMALAAEPPSSFILDPAIDAAVDARTGPPIWLSASATPSAIAKLTTILRRAPLDGFPAGPDLAARIDALAVITSASTDQQAIAAADRFMTSAWIAYVAALSVTSNELEFAEPWLRPVTPNARTTLQKLAATPSLTDHLDAVSAVNPVYSELRDAAWAAIQRSGSTAPDPRLLKNLARARAFPRSGRFIVVNAATQRLTMVEDGRIADSMKIIVGTKATPTPMLASMIWYVTVNPYWYVPLNLTKDIVAGRMLANPGYLKFKQYEVISDFGPTPTLLSPDGIDWKAVKSGEKIVYLRQLPGPHNSMGKMKFSFPSDTGVYLHDTDLHGLFARDPRTLSNGCVRLEDALRLGRWMMGHEVVGATGAPEDHQKLASGVPVFLTYIAAKVDDGRVTFTPDPYDRDDLRQGG